MSPEAKTKPSARRAARMCWPAGRKPRRPKSPPKNCSRKAPPPSPRPRKPRKPDPSLTERKKAGLATGLFLLANTVADTPGWTQAAGRLRPEIVSERTLAPIIAGFGIAADQDVFV